MPDLTALLDEAARPPAGELDLEALEARTSALRRRQTALRVTGAYERSALVAHGWAQGKGVARQVRALQAASADGVSLYVRPEAGNAAEVTLIGQSLERLRALTGPNGLLILDAACGLIRVRKAIIAQSACAACATDVAAQGAE